MLSKVCERRTVRMGKILGYMYLLAGTLPATEGLRPVLFRPLGVARDKQTWFIWDCGGDLIGKVCCRGKVWQVGCLLLAMGFSLARYERTKTKTLSANDLSLK